MSRFKKYFWATTRLTVYVAVCAFVVFYVDYRMAQASIMEKLAGIGQRMAPYMDDARATEPPRLVRINGVQVYTAVGTTTHPPEFVKRFYQDRYASQGDELSAFADKLRKRGALPKEVSSLNQSSFGDDKAGGLAALDFGGPITMRGFIDRVSRFGQTKNIGDIGRLRYVYWEKLENGGTRFITAWTDENFSLDRFMPVGQADAEGNDLDDVPRFPGTSRVLSADERGQPQRIVVYAGKLGSPVAAELFYRTRMVSSGWMLDDTFAKTAVKQGHQSLLFENKKGHEVVLDFSDESNGQGVTVVAVQTR